MVDQIQPLPRMSATGKKPEEILQASDSRAAGQRLIGLRADLFREHFNRRHFLFEHALSGHPLFQLPRLVELARETAQTRPSDLYYDAGVTDIGERWGASPCALPIDETMRRIETCNAWIILKYAEKNPAYAKLLDACMSDILEVSGRQLRKFMRRCEVIVFITSPRRLTTYHIDSECNFLLQLRGRKQINVFRADDREVLPEEEIERFWTVDSNAAVYKPHLQHHAAVIDLEPGRGIHIPINAPHWLQNGDDVSISVSINYHPWESERGNIYCLNYHLRKLKLKPTPPFKSPALDAIKRPAGEVIRRIRWAIHGPVGNRY
jgi:hypothetical protein